MSDSEGAAAAHEATRAEVEQPTSDENVVEQEQSVSRDAAAAPSEAARGPKVVRRVVCSYKLGWLPGDWLQTWRRLDRVFARAELKVKATLAPLEDLPEDTDILVVPPELREEARSAVPPGTPILVTPASAAPGAFADLVTRLEAGTELTAEKMDPAEKKAPKI